jgi:hypothetical protein
MPWAPDWTLQGSTFANFLGNSTGPMNEAFLRNVSSLGIAGLGWNSFFQLTTDPASFTNPKLLGHLEVLQGAEAEALKRLRPAQRVMVSADIDCTAAFWKVSQAAMANKTLAAELFLHWPNGTIFLDAWGSTPAPWWNYSSPTAVEFWTTQGPIAQAMQNPSINGVYLDGADIGVRHGRAVGAWDCRVFRSGAQQAQYLADAKTALWRAIAYWRQQQPKKWLTGYLSDGSCEKHGGADCAFHCPHGACAGPVQLAPAPRGRSGAGKPNPMCAPTMRSLIANSERANQTMMIQANSDMVQVKCAHLDWTKPTKTFDCAISALEDPAPYVAVFLVVRGQSAALQLAIQPQITANYRALFSSLRLEPGAPLGVATETGPGVFARKFAKITVTFNCQSFNATFKSDDETNFDFDSVGFEVNSPSLEPVRTNSYLVEVDSMYTAPSWGGPCKSDLDCSLNGLCGSGSVCTCDVGYTGERCELFDFLPTPAASGFHSPALEGNVSSWGGTAVYDPSSKLWHGFFSEFYGGCGVLSWESQSQIVHAVSSSPTGPFIKNDVTIGAEAHNAEARRDPVTGEYLLFHIGSGSNAGKTMHGIKCSNGSTASCIQCVDEPYWRTENKNFPWRCCRNMTTVFPLGSAQAGTSILHHSSSPTGPWVPLQGNLSLANLQPHFCRDNPTSYFAPNGTVYVLAVCHLPNGRRDAASHSDSTEGLPSILMLWRANSWTSAFQQIGNVTRSNSNGEKQWSWVDPTLWVDTRGNVHVVANMGHAGDDCRPIGAHAFSADGGRTFHSFCTGADPAKLHPIWNGTTEFVGSAGTRWLHFERPKIVLDPSRGTPIALFASVGSHCFGVTDDRSWTIARPIRSPPPPPPAGGASCNWIANTDYVTENIGNDIVGVNLTRQECCDICKRHINCTFAVFGTPTEKIPRSCWLKTGDARKDHYVFSKGVTTCCPVGTVCHQAKPPLVKMDDDAATRAVKLCGCTGHGKGQLWKISASSPSHWQQRGGGSGGESLCVDGVGVYRTPGGALLKLVQCAVARNFSLIAALPGGGGPRLVATPSTTSGKLPPPQLCVDADYGGPKLQLFQCNHVVHGAQDFQLLPSGQLRYSGHGMQSCATVDTSDPSDCPALPKPSPPPPRPPPPIGPPPPLPLMYPRYHLTMPTHCECATFCSPIVSQPRQTPRSPACSLSVFSARL